MFEIEITPEGGEPFPITADSRDVMLWEPTTAKSGPSIGRLANDPRITDLYKIAWFACKRLGLLRGIEPEEFQTDYAIKVDFENAGWGEDENPTRKTATSGE